MSTIITNNDILKIVSKIFKNVYSREVGGQNRAKFGLLSFWMTPIAIVLIIKVSGFDKLKNISLLYILGIYFKSIIVLMNKQKRWKIWIYVRWNFSPNTEIILRPQTDAWKKKEGIDTIFFAVSFFMHHFGFILNQIFEHQIHFFCARGRPKTT